MAAQASTRSASTTQTSCPAAAHSDAVLLALSRMAELMATPFNGALAGEYAERIDNADELLETFLETFPEETSMVRNGRP